MNKRVENSAVSEENVEEDFSCKNFRRNVDIICQSVCVSVKGGQNARHSSGAPGPSKVGDQPASQRSRSL